MKCFDAVQPKLKPKLKDSRSGENIEQGGCLFVYVMIVATNIYSFISVHGYVFVFVFVFYFKCCTVLVLAR